MSKNKGYQTLRGSELADQIEHDLKKNKVEVWVNAACLLVCLFVFAIQDQEDLFVLWAILGLYLAFCLRKAYKNLSHSLNVLRFARLVKGKGERLECFFERNEFNRNEKIGIERYMGDDPSREMIALELLQVILNSNGSSSVQVRERAHALAYKAKTNYQRSTFPTKSRLTCE